MAQKRKTHSAQFKAKVALEALRDQHGQRTGAQVLHPSQPDPRLEEAVAGARVQDEETQMVPELYQQIGRLQVELDWLKKNTNLSVADRRAMVGPQDDQLSVSRQCELVGLPRSSFYYQPLAPDSFSLEVMHAIDRIYTDRPFYGVRAHLVDVEERRLAGQSQARAPADAGDGSAGDLPAKAPVAAR